MSFPAKHTTSIEIKVLISKLKERKLLGYDIITNEILKNQPRKNLGPHNLYFSLYSTYFLFSNNMEIIHN